MDSFFKLISGKSKIISLVAAIALFLSQMIVVFRHLLNYIEYGSFYSIGIGNIISILLTGLLAILLIGGTFVKIANTLLVIPLGGLLLSNVVSLFRNIGYFFDYFSIYNFAGVIYNLLQVAAIILLIFATIHLAVDTPLSSYVQKLWFIPGILLFIAFAIDFIVFISYYFGSFINFISLPKEILWIIACTLIGLSISSQLLDKSNSN